MICQGSGFWVGRLRVIRGNLDPNVWTTDMHYRILRLRIRAHICDVDVSIHTGLSVSLFRGKRQALQDKPFLLPDPDHKIG